MKRSKLFIYFFPASFFGFVLKTDGSLYAERKCLVTGLARGWWLPSNDNNGIEGECEQQCSLPSSGDAQTDGLQPADTVALAARLALSPPTGKLHPLRLLFPTRSLGFPLRDATSCISFQKGQRFRVNPEAKKWTIDILTT